MIAPETRVGSLVAEGRLTREEGERLYRALQGKNGSGSTAFGNPVEWLRPPLAVALALGVIVASLVISQLGVRFDGVIDVHRVAGTPSWRTAATDQLIAVPLMSLVFWIASLAVWRRGRWQDFALATALGRVPALVLCAWSMLIVPDVPSREQMLRMAQSGDVPLPMLISSVGTIPLLVWMIFWLYRGFVFAAGARGSTAVAVFALALGIAMAIGELAVRWLL